MSFKTTHEDIASTPSGRRLRLRLQLDTSNSVTVKPLKALDEDMVVEFLFSNERGEGFLAQKFSHKFFSTTENNLITFLISNKPEDVRLLVDEIDGSGNVINHFFRGFPDERFKRIPIDVFDERVISIDFTSGELKSKGIQTQTIIDNMSGDDPNFIAIANLISKQFFTFFSEWTTTLEVAHPHVAENWNPQSTIDTQIREMWVSLNNNFDDLNEKFYVDFMIAIFRFLNVNAGYSWTRDKVLVLEHMQGFDGNIDAVRLTQNSNPLPAASEVTIPRQTIDNLIENNGSYFNIRPENQINYGHPSLQATPLSFFRNQDPFAMEDFEYQLLFDSYINISGTGSPNGISVNTNPNTYAFAGRFDNVALLQILGAGGIRDIHEMLTQQRLEYTFINQRKIEGMRVTGLLDPMIPIMITLEGSTDPHQMTEGKLNLSYDITEFDAISMRSKNFPQ